MKLTQTEKANRYDAITCEIREAKAGYEKLFKDIETELTLPASEQIHAMLVGKKYLLMEVIETMEGWCK